MSVVSTAITTTCKNCKTEIDSKFCPVCGQNSETHRVTVGYVLHESFHSITHADKGFLMLAKQLMTRPGHIAREYVEGRRKTYFNPLTYLILTSAIFYYVGTTTGYLDSLSGGGGATNRRMPELMAETFELSQTSGKWLTILLIAPLCAALTSVFFIGKKFNYAEHFILHAFILGQAGLLRLVILIPIYYIAPERQMLMHWLVYEPIFIAYLAISYHQFYKQHIAWTAIKAVLIRLLFIVLFWLVLLGIVFLKHQL